MSITPVLRNPNCAGSAPVMSEILSAKRVSSTWPKPGILSGISTSSMRYLQICMFAADVKLSERILRDTGETQQSLVKWRVFTFRLGAETVRSNRIARGTETRHNCFTRNVHLLTLDDHALRFFCACG